MRIGGLLPIETHSCKTVSDNALCNLLTGHCSKLEIQRELDLAGTGSGNRLRESRHRRQTRAEDRIDLGDIHTVEQVEEFRYHVETFRPAEREILQDAESIVASAGVFREFLPRASGLAENGKA
jgi:hypothetical protein